MEGFTIRAPKGQRKNKRLGRGVGSGHGKTAGSYDVTLNPAANLPGAAGTGSPCFYCHDDSVNHGDTTVMSIWEVTVSRNFEYMFERAQKVAGWASIVKNYDTGPVTGAAVLALDRGAFFQLSSAQRQQIVNVVIDAGGYVRLFREMRPQSLTSARSIASQLR